MSDPKTFEVLGGTCGWKPGDRAVIENLWVERVYGAPFNTAIVRWGEVRFQVPVGALLLPVMKESES